MEVETPVLSRYGNTDPNLSSFTTSFSSPAGSGPVPLYLNTSPEFAMKRLLAAGSGSIYQISRVFRNSELGRCHQPEFTMLEWYRTGFDHHALMDEVDRLLRDLGLGESWRRTYGEAFERSTGLNPHQAGDELLRDAAAGLGLEGDEHDRRTLLDFLFSTQAGQELGCEHPEFIYDFPVCQAALARVREGDPPVAERFELFIHGVEIANGFHELKDAGEQLRRFEVENAQRRARGLPAVAIDQDLIAALEQGLPDCAGVALGLDRLVMVLDDARGIDEVLAFPMHGRN